MITLLLWYEKYLQVPGTLAHRMKALGRQQIDFSFFNELCMCLFQQQSFPISFWRATNSLFNIQGCLVGPLDCLWQSPWLDVTHAWHLKLHLVTIDEEMSNGTSVSCYLIISFRLPSICAHFGKLVLCKLFMNLQIALRFGCLSPYSLPHPPLPPSSCLIILFQFSPPCSCTYTTIYSISTFWVDPFIPLVTYSIPSFCSYIDCNISYQRLNIHLQVYISLDLGYLT